MKKQCTKCGIEKDINEFWKDKTRKNGYRSWCKDCDKEKSTRWRKLNPEKVRGLDKKWRLNNKAKLTKKKRAFYKKNKDKISVHKKRYYKENKDKVLRQCKKYRENNKKIMKKRKSKYFKDNFIKIREKNLKRTYGISIKEYSKLFLKQKGNCAICGRNQKCQRYNFSVDHNHKNGKIRGLLCTKCNFLIGHANDDINILSNAVKYLRGYK